MLHLLLQNKQGELMPMLNSPMYSDDTVTTL